MIQNVYYKDKKLSDSEMIHSGRYSKEQNLIKDYFIYQASVSRKDLNGKKIKDIKYNLYGDGQCEVLRKKYQETKPDLLKALFFRNSLTIKSCNNDNSDDTL